MKITPETVLTERLYKLCLALEHFPASKHQTDVVTECAAIMQKVNTLEEVVTLAKPFLQCHTNIGYNSDPHYVQKILAKLDENGVLVYES